MKQKTLFLLMVLVLLLAACSSPSEQSEVGSAGNAAESENTGDNAPEEADVSASEGDAVFPLPSDYKNLIADDTSVNFQTSSSMDEMLDFYRGQFADMGLTERELLTVVEDTTASLVFDGDSSGMAVVLQMVDLGDSTNVNIRFEDV